MKHYIITLFLLIAGLNSKEQSTADIAIKDGKPIGITNVNDNIITTIKLKEVEGSPFLSENWNKGSVKFKRGRYADSLPLLFNLETNKLYFSHDSLTLEFIEEVTEFRFKYTEQGEMKQAFFRNNYPLIEQHTPETYYSILADGPKFHLLEYRFKKGMEIYVYSGPAKTKYKETDTWYIYNAMNKTMHKIKNSKSSVLKALPDYEAQINQLCSENNWELRSKYELIKLFEQLNR